MEKNENGISTSMPNFDVYEAYRTSILDPKAKIKAPEPALIQGDNPVFTLGNFSVIAGDSKSRKTFLATAITASFMGGSSFGMTPTIPRAKVLWIDTEQADGHVSLILQRINTLMKWAPDKTSQRLQMLRLRKYAPNERKAITELAIDTFNPTMVVVDGIADLIEDTNDAHASVSLVTGIMKITEDANIVLLGILHVNPSSDKLRGHLGSECLRKAETVILVKYEDEHISSATFFRCRNKPCNDFSFKIDELECPRLCNQSESDMLAEKKSALQALWRSIMKPQKNYSYKALCDKYMAKTSKSIETAKRQIKESAKCNVLRKNSDGTYMLEDGQFELSTLL